MKPKTKPPMFICIGLPKTGTTWLYRNLKKHPQVFLPNFKEISYFWRNFCLPDDGNLLKRYIRYHRFNKSSDIIFFKKRADKYLKNLFSIKTILVREFIWDFKYFCFPCTDSWYLSLFKIASGKISGDISPAYYRLPEEAIRGISELLPDAKIIIFVRNPIDRVFSNAKMELCLQQNKKFEEVPEQCFYDLFNKEFNVCPSYIRLIAQWSKYFPEKNIHVNFYEKLAAQPFEFLTEICEFLEIDINQFPKDEKDELSKKIFPGLEIKLPEKFAIYLAQLYENCIKEMCEHYEPYPQKWAEVCDNLLSKAKLKN